MRNKINLITLSDVMAFSNLCQQLDANIILTNSSNSYKINAKSMLGCLYSLEWNEAIYVESDKDIYMAIKDFIVE